MDILIDICDDIDESNFFTPSFIREVVAESEEVRDVVLRFLLC